MEGVCGDRNSRLLVVGGKLEAGAWKVFFLWHFTILSSVSGIPNKIVTCLCEI